MKYSKIIICLVILLSGCMLEFDTEANNFDIPEIGRALEVIHQSDITLGDKIRFIAHYVSNSIKYTSDGGNDNWQTPYTTYNKGTGDCEDFTLLFMYAIKKYLNTSSSLWVIDSPEKGHHAIGVVEDGGYIFGTDYGLEELNVLDKYSYEHALIKAHFDEMPNR